MQVTGEGGKGTVLCQHAWAMRKIYFSAKGLRFSPGRNKAKEPLQTRQVYPYRRNRFPQNLSSLSTSIIKLIMLSQRKKSLQHPSWHFQWERPSVSSYPGGTWLSDWWPQCIHWTCPLLCCMPDSRIHPSAAPPNLPEVLQNSSEAWRPHWQKHRGLAVLFLCSGLDTSQGMGPQYCTCPEGASTTTRMFSIPKSSNFKASHSEE